MEIKEIVNSVIDEVNAIGDAEGMCIYFANNISFDLQNAGYDVSMLNIRDYSCVDYNHYFNLVKDNDRYLLIDPAYRQFVKQEKRKIRKDLGFSVWPSETLKSMNNGSVILDGLLSDGMVLVNDEDVISYLKSFNPDMDIYFSLEDMFGYRR